MFTDLGYSKKSVVWKLGRTVASNSRSISSSYISKFFELTNNIPENVKNFLFFVTTSISYLLFRVYSTEQLMINATSTMAAARMERSVPEQQFIIPRPKENSWGHRRVLDKENIIWAFVGYTPVMNERKDAECMTAFLDSVIVSSGPGLNSF